MFFVYRCFIYLYIRYYVCWELYDFPTPRSLSVILICRKQGARWHLAPPSLSLHHFTLYKLFVCVLSLWLLAITCYFSHYYSHVSSVLTHYTSCHHQLRCLSVLSSSETEPAKTPCRLHLAIRVSHGPHESQLTGYLIDNHG